MRYIKATWVHNFDDEPVLYYQELDNANFEVRKIVIYKDGHSEIASEQFSNETTYLSPKPLPNIDEINSDPQFAAKEITKHEFEMKWNDLE